MNGDMVEVKGEVYPKDFSVVYRGNCLNVSKEGEGVVVSAMSHFFRTASLEVLEFFAPGYLPVTRVVQIGGLPLFPSFLPPTILLLPSAQTRVSIQVFSLDDQALQSFTLSVRSGYNNFTGPSDQYTFSYTEGILKLDRGVYSITTSSTGFKSDHSELTDENTLKIYLTRDDFSPSEIRVLLTWTSDSDLDLRSKFKFNENFECELASYNKICGSGHLTTTSKSLKNVEEIRLSQIAPVHYLFYIKEVKTGSQSFNEAKAVVKIYVKDRIEPVVVVAQQMKAQWNVDWKDYRIWNAFCIDGRFGASSIAPVQGYMNVRHSKYARSICAQVYGEERNLTKGNFKALVYESLKFPNNISLGG